MSIKHITASAVAGNVETQFTTPDNTQRRFLFGNLLLTTDATVADRWVRLHLSDDAGNNILCLCAGNSVAASQTDQRFSYLQGVYREASFINGVIQVPIAKDLILPPGYRLDVLIENGVAGDAYSCDLMVDDTHIGARI